MHYCRDFRLIRKVIYLLDIQLEQREHMCVCVCPCYSALYLCLPIYAPNCMAFMLSVNREKYFNVENTISQHSIAKWNNKVDKRNQPRKTKWNEWRNDKDKWIEEHAEKLVGLILFVRAKQIVDNREKWHRLRKMDIIYVEKRITIWLLYIHTIPALTPDNSFIHTAWQMA